VPPSSHGVCFEVGNSETSEKRFVVGWNCLVGQKLCYNQDEFFGLVFWRMSANCIFLAYLVQVLLYIFEEPVGGFRKFRGLVAPFYSGFSSHSFLRFLSIRYYRTCSCLHPWFWDCFRGAFPFPSLYWLVHFNTNSTSF